MRAVVVGAGAAGARAARQLVSTSGFEGLVVVDTNSRRAAEVVDSLGDRTTTAAWSPDLVKGADVLVLASPGAHRPLAEAALEAGADVVSTSDDVECVRGLLDLDAEATERNLVVAAGAGFSPGLTCLLARHAAGELDMVDEVHVARFGTAGAACARQHHRALRAHSLDWRDRTWSRARGGSGRELCWFPDPIGGLDCYRAAVPDALLLVPAFVDATRITARVAATRRDRITGRLPMLRRPHIEGLIGAVRVEVRGTRGAGRDTRILGAVDRPGVACGTVAAVTAAWAADARMARAGAGGLADLVRDVPPFLHELARRGVRAAVFEGGWHPGAPCEHGVAGT